jgi:hypothetical protein
VALDAEVSARSAGAIGSPDRLEQASSPDRSARAPAGAHRVARAAPTRGWVDSGTGASYNTIEQIGANETGSIQLRN